MPALLTFPHAAHRTLSTPGVQFAVMRSQGRDGERVLTLVDGDSPIGGDNQRLALPDTLSDDDALLVPHVARALAAWEALGLELGEAALCGGDGAEPRLLAVAARWGGACPVIRLTTETAAMGDTEIVSPNDPLAAIARIQALTAQSPGVAAVDLSEHAAMTSTILEALPRFGRLIVAGRAVRRFTTDVYADLHRKGTIVQPAPVDIAAVFADLSPWRPRLTRAVRLMMVTARAAEVRAVLDDAV